MVNLFMHCHETETRDALVTIHMICRSYQLTQPDLIPYTGQQLLLMSPWFVLMPICDICWKIKQIHVDKSYFAA